MLNFTRRDPNVIYEIFAPQYLLIMTPQLTSLQRFNPPPPYTSKKIIEQNNPYHLDIELKI